jgi:hypothetical protein
MAFENVRLNLSEEEIGESLKNWIQFMVEKVMDKFLDSGDYTKEEILELQELIEIWVLSEANRNLEYWTEGNEISDKIFSGMGKNLQVRELINNIREMESEDSEE